DEVLTTSTAGGIKAIVEVDGRPIGNGQKGPITRALGEQYEAMLVS
ncbi:MAG: branched-chain amino acid aminotransferase, partial [Chloroflexi bacterium]|nr:branched-chain amino acid aminotransferase [Chloroflexota bacterium]